MKFLAILIITLMPNSFLTRANYFESNNNFNVVLPRSRSKPEIERPANVLRFMKKLYKKVNSGRISWPADANTVRSIWPLGGKSDNGHMVYNVSSPRTEKLVKAVLYIKKRRRASHHSRIIIDTVPIPGRDSPLGINLPLKEANHLDIKWLLLHAQKIDSMLTMKVEELQNGSWIGLKTRKSPIIVIFSSDILLPIIDLLGYKHEVLKQSIGAKPRRKRESNSIHSQFLFKDLPEEADFEQTLEKYKFKSDISKRQRYLKKKLNQKKIRKHKKKRKSSKRRKQMRNGFIPYPKNYYQGSKDHGENRKRKKIPQSFISASMNRISNEVPTTLGGGPMTSGVCELHKLFVDFKDLGWDFVIAPSGFNPNYCSGGCPNTLSRTDAGTNHALIRSLMRHIGQWRNLSQSYCVADKLTSLTLLVQNKDDRIELKNYPQMQAESCSCQ